MVLQHCEGVLQWFVPGVSNIAETLILSIARGVRNCFAALQKGVAMVLLHCEGFLQWLCFAALRGDLAMPLLGFLIAKGSCNGLISLYYEGLSQWLLSRIHVPVTCLDAWAKRKLLFGILGLNSITCLDVWGRRHNVLQCLG